MKVGYARVSTKEQNLDIQIAALEKEGCEIIYQEKDSGFNEDRKELEKALSYLRKDDEFVIYDLFRLGRTSKQIMLLVEEFLERGIGFKSLVEGFDIKTPLGKAMTYIWAIFGEVDMRLKKERQRDGIEKARKRGVTGGRPGITEEKKMLIKTLYDSKDYTVTDIAKQAGVSRATVHNVVKERKK